MRIGLDGKRAFFNKTGLGNFSRTFLWGYKNFVLNTQADHGLNQVGIQLIIYAVNPNNSSFYESLKLLLQKIKSPSSLIFSGPSFWIGRKFSTLWRGLYLGRKSLIDECDLYYGPSQDLPFFYSLGKKSAYQKMAKVVTIHDLLPLKYPSFFPFFDRWIYQLKLLRCVQKADLIHCISKATEDDCLFFFGKNLKKKTRVVYQSIDLDAYKENVGDDDRHRIYIEIESQLGLKLSFSENTHHSLSKRPYILMVGAPTERKNHLVVLKAWAEILQDKTQQGEDISSFPALILVGGKGDQEKRLERELQNLPIAYKSLFIHHGNFNQRELILLYQGALFSCYPSLDEGLGLPLLESLISGTPVLAHEGGIFKEVLGELGDEYPMLFVHRENLRCSGKTSDWKEAILKMMLTRNSSEFHSTFKLRSRKYAENRFTQKDFIYGMDKIFREAIEIRRREAFSSSS